MAASPVANLDQLASTPKENGSARPAQDKLSLDEMSIVPSESSDAWDQFRYAFDKAGNISTYSANILESYFPLGRITFDIKDGFDYVPAGEAYGEDFMQATPEQRREIIMERKAEALEAEYGSDFKEDTESAANFLGQAAKAIADPTSLLPAGATYKAMAGIAGGLGGTYSVLEDVSTNKDVDTQKALQVAGASAVLAPAVAGAARFVTSRVSDKASNKIIKDAQQKIEKKISEGYEVKDLPNLLREEGVDLAKLADAQNKMNKKLTIPGNANPADQAIKRAITKDSATSRIYSPSLDKYLGTLSTRVRNISEPVFGRLRRFEFNSHVKTQSKGKEVELFLLKLSKINEQQKNIIARNLYNGNFKAAEALMNKVSPDLVADFNAVKNTLNNTADELLASGHSFEKLENYFPRKVKDVNGLLNSLGSSEKSKIEKAIKDYAKSKNTSPSLLDPDEKAEIIDLVVRGYGVKTDGYKPSFVKPRVIQQISDDQLKFYASPEESLHSYVRGAVNDIEKRKFFGRASEETSGRFDTDASIGKFVADELEAGNIPSEKQDELVELLRARFVSGETPTGAALGALRSLGYMGTIANPISAITQLGDTGISAALNGFRNTFKSMFGAKEAKLFDIGLDDVMTEELSDAGLMSKALNATLRAGMFKTFDRIGKETYINAALKKARGLAKSDKGIENLRKDWGAVFGDEFEPFVADLKSGSMTDNVKYYLFNEISDVQPVSLSEMPQAYLESPNGRVLYMLKSFMLKQYDIARRKIVQQYKKGNKKQAIRNAAAMAGYMTAANVSTGVVKDLLLGREVRPEDIPSRSMWALLGVYGLNQYTSERYLQRGDVKGAVVNQLVPATPIIDAAFKLGTELPKDDPNLETTMKAVPVVGPIVYNWFGGGAERFNEKLND